jgi:amino acid transporter
MANLAQIAGSYTFQLFGLDSLAASTFWTTVAGIIWIIIMTYICYRGIEISARIQMALLSIEVVILVIFSAVALTKVYRGTSPAGSLHPSWSWLWPGGLSLTAISTATLIAVFIYWGWDTAVSVNEETSDPSRTPGRAAIISTLLLLVTYAIVTVATVAFAGVGDKNVGLGNADNSSDVFHAIGTSVFGGSGFCTVMEDLLIIAVLSSASASTQTTILPTARTALSMGAFRAIPEKFARIHPRYLTPIDATLWMGGVSILFYVGLTMVSENVLGDSISAVGLMIAFYYGMTGFACVWFYRRMIAKGGRDLWMKGVLPFLGGVLLLGAFLDASYNYAQPDYGNTTIFGIGGVFVIGIGALVLGGILMVVYRFVSPPFFRGETLMRRGAHDLILAGMATEPLSERESIGLPGSGMPDIVIAPDLSNLPKGATTVDPHTGETIRSPRDPGRGEEDSREEGPHQSGP